MFDIGWDEMALIAVVSLIVIGPKDLPVVLRQMGRWTRKARDMAAEFQRGMDDMVRESELEDLKKQVTRAGDPNLLRLEVEKAIDPTGELANSMKVPSLDEVAAAPSAPAADAPNASDLPPLDQIPGLGSPPPEPAEPPVAIAADAEPSRPPGP